MKIFSDVEITAIVDEVLKKDINMDGFIDYPEFIKLTTGRWNCEIV